MMIYGARSRIKHCKVAHIQIAIVLLEILASEDATYEKLRDQV